MISNSRRSFVKNCAWVSVGFLGLQTLACKSNSNSRAISEAASGTAKALKVGYGELIKDTNGLLNLPKGFSYKVISRLGNKMSDGLLVPGAPDGMATFAGRGGRIIIIRNHELSPKYPELSAWGKDKALFKQIDRKKLYDYGKGKMPCLGGTTTLVYNPRTQEVETEYLSLAGTIRNCAGGVTPWKSWLSCEEDVSKAGGNLEKDHGYVFEVPASETPQLFDPIPYKAMGRFNHEAVCIDPRTGIVYLTEDRHDGLLYRFIPKEPGKLDKGGQLQALAIKDAPQTDTRNWKENKQQFPLNEAVEVKWINLDNVEAPEDDLRMQGFSKGAARFARGEGMWFGDCELYFACTNGGNIKKGQVFRYIPSEFEGTEQEQQEGGRLELFVEPNNTDICKNCDNLTIANWGDLILCEDHKNPFINGVTPNGDFYKLAENTGHPDSEFTGATFSPDGQILFVNIQHAGLTLAITGPWLQT